MCWVGKGGNGGIIFQLYWHVEGIGEYKEHITRAKELDFIPSGGNLRTFGVERSLVGTP